MKMNHVFYGEFKTFILFNKTLRDGAELFIDATEFCSQLDW